MANRKVLINRHSKNAVAPIAKDMYLGEIAISHPAENLGATTIYTKNGDVMVPFASCAMTMSMISNAIDAANVTYEVKAADNDAHVAVVSKGTNKAKVFEVSSKDVQSKSEFEAYSSKTTNALTALTQSFSELLDVTLTAGTGDDIISVSTASTGASANTFSVTHAKAPEAITADFNKLATDAYGHVTGATAVETADIERLGFKTSTATTAEITAAIEALDVTDTAEAGKYVSKVSETDGKISVERLNVSDAVLNGYAKGKKPASTEITADDTVKGAISKLEHQIDAAEAAAAKANTKVEKNAAATHLTLTSTTAGDGSVTYTIGESDIASKSNLDALSDAVESFSAATEAKFTDTDAAIETLSGNVVNYVKSVSGNIESVINAMDKSASVVVGQVVTTVSQTDGKVAETKANVKDLQLGGYSKDASATGSIGATDTINAALSKLENVIGANKITNSDKSIVVTAPTGTATTTDVKVNIKSDEKVIKLGNEGLYTNLNLVKITESLPTTVKERYEFRDSNNNKIGESIDIAKDSHIVSITYDESAQTLIYKYMDVEGAEKTANVNMAHLVLETEVENGVQSNGGKLSIKLDTTGDDTGNGKFLSVGANGLKLDGVSDAIKAAVEALDVTDAAVAGQYVSSVNETDGKIAVARANVSDAVLTGYAKGEKPADATIAATDDVKGAIAKLEHQIDAAKAAATTKVVEGSDAGNNMAITSAAGADNSVTYTVNLTDVASKAALDAEIAARKAVDGQNGQTYAKNTKANYIANAASLNDADVKLDAALKAVSDKVNAVKVTEGASVENFVGLTLDTATTAGTTALTINDSALQTKINAIDASISAETKARKDAIAALDSTGVTTGDGYFLTSVKIADGKITAVTQSDKANSASSADKVVNALSISGYASSESKNLDTTVSYDGSVAQSMTFGKDTAAGKSMSFNDGIIDVEIIDCGEY